MNLSERLDIAAKIQEDMSGKTALSTTIREAAEVVRRVECQQVEAGGCAPPVVVGHLQVNEPFGNPEQFDVNEPSGNSGQLASLEQRAAVTLPHDIVDEVRKALRSSANCSRAYHVEQSSKVALANLEDAITAALANQQGAGGAWLGTDIDSLRSIVLDETGCMVDLALYIASPNDGGPTIRQGRYDATCGFVDSTTGRRIHVDAWSAPSLAVAPQDAGGGGAAGNY